MNKESKIYIAGHNGMVGSAITRKLTSEGFTNLVFTPFPTYDLTNQQTVADFFIKEKPEYVFLAAAKVGGILSNNIYRAQFIYDNLMIQNNIIHHSYLNGVKKLLFLGSSCVYPRNCPQPIREEYLLTSELEYTNEPYAIAKISGIKMCESYNIQYGTNYISVMPTNLYGPNDNYNLDTSHVLPALIRKMHLGKCLENNDWNAIRKDFEKHPVKGISPLSANEEIIESLRNYGINLLDASASRKMSSSDKMTKVSITLWGTGKPYREFLFVDDLADACLFVMNNYNSDSLKPLTKGFVSEYKNVHLNIGTGKDQTIGELAVIISEVVGFKGELFWDETKPDGTYRKLLDISGIRKSGWKEKISLREGIKMAYASYSDLVI
jgi:GDP-L-fucose synthase